MYQKLYKAWRDAMAEGELQPLSDGFYIELNDYIRELKRRREKLNEETIGARLIESEIENAVKMLKDLVRIRREKIILGAFRGGSPQDRLTKEEAKLEGELRPILKAYSGVLRELTRGKADRAKAIGIKPKRILVRFIREIPAIVGSDLKVYGPFKREDIASLPPENAKALIGQGVAVKIKVEDR